MFALEMCFFSCWVCQIARAKAIRLVNIRIESVVTQDFSFFFLRNGGMFKIVYGHRLSERF